MLGRIAALVCAVVCGGVVLIGLAGSAVAQQTAPARGGALWKGNVTQQGRTGTYPIEVTLTANGGSTFYPDQVCTGTLRRIGLSGSYVFFAEQITQGRYDAAANAGCFDGTVTISEASGTLYFGWFGVVGTIGVIAMGPLTREAPGAPANTAVVAAPLAGGGPAPVAAAAAGAPNGNAAGGNAPGGNAPAGNAPGGNFPSAAFGAGNAPRAAAPRPTAAASGAAGGAHLAPDEIQAIFNTGAPIVATDPAGRKSTMTFRSDGTASTSGGSGKPTVGTWHFWGEGYCSKWGTSAERCFTVTRTANGYDVQDSANKVVARWRG